MGKLQITGLYAFLLIPLLTNDLHGVMWWCSAIIKCNLCYCYDPACCTFLHLLHTSGRWWCFLVVGLVGWFARCMSCDRACERLHVCLIILYAVHLMSRYQGRNTHFTHRLTSRRSGVERTKTKTTNHPRSMSSGGVSIVASMQWWEGWYCSAKLAIRPGLKAFLLAARTCRVLFIINYIQGKWKAVIPTRYTLLTCCWLAGWARA